MTDAGEKRPAADPGPDAGDGGTKASSPRDLHPAGPWDDDERIRVLYSPFRTKELNPDAWEAKNNFWTDMIKRYLRRTKKISFSLKDVEADMTWRDQRPQGLREVLQRLVLAKDGQIRVKSDLMDALRRRMTAPSWTDAMKTLGWLAWKKLWRADVDQVCLVSVENLDSMCDKIKEFARHSPESFQIGGDTVVSLTALRSCMTAAHVILSDDEVDLCLMKLQADRLVSVAVVDRDTFVLVSPSGTVPAFNECTSNIVRLKVFSSRLEEDATKKEKLLSESKDLVRKELSNQNKAKAKFYLKRVKRQENALQRILNLAENIETILSKLEDARDANEVASAYNQALRALKATLSKHDADSVQNLLVELGEVMQETDDLSSELAGLALTESGNDEDLEKELEELLKQDPLRLPDVPSEPVADQAISSAKKKAKLIELN